MANMHELDAFIVSLGTPFTDEPVGFFRTEAELYLAGLRKLAAEGDQGPGIPATEFAAPPEDIVQTFLLLASQILGAHTAYAVYGAALRGSSRDALADAFEEIAEADLEDAKYCLSKANIIADGAPLQMPPIPPPPPLTDEAQMIQYILDGSNRVIALLKTLRVQVGENPVKYTIEQMISDEQGHHDKLVQHLPAGAPRSSAPAQEGKVASVLHRLKLAYSPDQVMEREVLGERAQAQAEANFLRQQMELREQELGAARQQIEALNASSQAAQQQLQAVQQQADMTQQQLAQTQQQAEMASAQVADLSDKKMRLSMRIQQFRQQLADIVSQDPVSEEGAGPDAGMPAAPDTATQQAQAAAAQQPPAQAAPASPKETAKQEDEAVRAQQKADEQTQQAQAAETKTSALKLAGIRSWLGRTAKDTAEKAVEGATSNPEHYRTVGKALGEGLGRSLVEGADRAISSSQFKKSVTNAKRGLLAAGGLYAGHKALQHAEKIRDQNQRGRELDQRERVIRAYQGQ